jgi:colanic acid/amylovoran biosynthesis glycosyltransferase
MPKPIVASYCTTFLKPEMRHIYRQVTGLQRYDTVVLTRERLEAEQFPFSDVEVIPRARKNFLKRFYLKYIRRLPPVYYRGELQVLIKLLKRRPVDLMHIYFGHTGVHLLPLVEEWPQPCVVSFHGMDIQPRPQQQGYDEQMQRLLQTVPLVLARSRSLMDRLEQLGCPADKLRLNRTGIPLEQFPSLSSRCRWTAPGGLFRHADWWQRRGLLQVSALLRSSTRSFQRRVLLSPERVR